MFTLFEGQMDLFSFIAAEIFGQIFNNKVINNNNTNNPVWSKVRNTNSSHLP